MFPLTNRSLPLKKRLGFLCLPSAPPARLISGGLRVMVARWIQTLANGRAPFLYVTSSFVRVCVLLRKRRQWRLPEDGIRFSPPSPHPSGASSIVCGRVEVCLRRICPWWICSDLVIVRLRSFVFKLDLFHLRYSSTARIVVLVRWSYEALARRLPDCLP